MNLRKQAPKYMLPWKKSGLPIYPSDVFIFPDQDENFQSFWGNSNLYFHWEGEMGFLSPTFPSSGVFYTESQQI